MTRSTHSTDDTPEEISLHELSLNDHDQEDEQELEQEPCVLEPSSSAEQASPTSLTAPDLFPAAPTQRAQIITTRKQNRLSQFALPPSPAESMLLESGQHSLPGRRGQEDNSIMRDISRGAPGDEAIFSEHKTPEQKDYARRKSQHYSEAFACREPNSSARERVSKESIVMADVRTNVIIQDEYTFITDLSYSLSSRYQRPESSILVSVTHSACMLFGGSFDPAYTLTVTALPSQVQQVTNKRNAALLQKNMEEALGVTPDRGVVKFVAIAEENLATNGKTAAWEIEALEIAEGGSSRKASVSNNRKSMMVSAGRKGSVTGSIPNKANKRKSTRTGYTMPTHDERMTPPLSEKQSALLTSPMPDMPSEPSALDMQAERVQKMSKRKSFLNVIRGKP